MSKAKDFDSLKENVLADINSCSSKELNKIYTALKKTVFEFDRDVFGKQIRDFFKSVFKSKKDKCVFFVEDICDSKDKLSSEEKETLRKMFLDISNIHRTFLEDLIALLEAL